MEKNNIESIVTDRLKLMQEGFSHNQKESNNLYHHLCQLITQLTTNNSNHKLNSIKQLPTISEFIKNNRNRQNQAEPLLEPELLQKVTHQLKYPDWLNQQNQLHNKARKHNQEQNNKHKFYIQNFEKANQSLLSNIGIKFSQQEAYRINVSMKELAKKVDAKNMRFWGKILTKTTDYYIIQGVANKKNPQNIVEGMEKYGEGVNYYSYWVNNTGISNQWHQLPFITPEQVRNSRLIKYIFTGNPNTIINSYPAFQGREQHFLKAQLVRITHNCQIAPRGLYASAQQNPDEIQFAEQFKLPDFNELSNLQNWVHINPYILQLGRNTYWVDPSLSPQQQQQLMTKLNETDPRMQRLKGINEDKAVEKMGIEGCWFAKVIGSNQIFNNVGKDEGTTSCYATVTLKNANWPGWMTLSNMNMFDSIYIGYGIKATQPSFFPLGPENLMIEGQDADQISEPNPRDPPDELEPDSDDENKKPEE